jgi:hypothetical protein
MFRVFIQDGEFELDDAAEVLKLLDAHDFHGDGDFFTIGRGDVDYLEIYQYGDRYSLAYIPPGADESHPLAEELPRPFVARLAAAFCAGREDWQSLLANVDLDLAESAGRQKTSARRATAPLAAASGVAPPPAAPFDARPIEPRGVTAGLFLRIVFLLSALGLLAAIGYAFLHR